MRRSDWRMTYAVRQSIEQLLEIALLSFRHADLLDQTVRHAIRSPDGEATGFVIGRHGTPGRRDCLKSIGGRRRRTPQRFDHAAAICATAPPGSAQDNRPGQRKQPGAAPGFGADGGVIVDDEIPLTGLFRVDRGSRRASGSAPGLIERNTSPLPPGSIRTGSPARQDGWPGINSGGC